MRPLRKIVQRSRGARFPQLVASAARWSASGARAGIAAAQSRFASLSRATMDLVFPAACLSCNAEIDPGDHSYDRLAFCSECYEALDLFRGPVCRRCGGPLPLSSGATPEPVPATPRTSCFRCSSQKMWFDETVAAGLYEGRLRELLLRMKTQQGDPLSLAMGRLLWQLRGNALTSWNVDVVAPIPLHWRRQLSHRTNSAAVVAEVLADSLHVPRADGLLRRNRSTRPQSELSPAQRWKNVRNAFFVGSAYHLNGAHVLLVDDILTTGATCSDASRALRRAGATRVSIAVVARAIGQ